MNKNLEQVDKLNPIRDGTLLNKDDFKNIINPSNICKQDYKSEAEEINFTHHDSCKHFTLLVAEVFAFHYYFGLSQQLYIIIVVSFKDRKPHIRRLKITEMVDLNNLLLRFESYDYYVEYIAEYILDVDMCLDINTPQHQINKG